MTTLEQIRTSVAAIPIPMEFVTETDVARVGQVPSTSRRTGFSLIMPFENSWARVLFSAICAHLLLNFGIAEQCVVDRVGDTG